MQTLNNQLHQCATMYTDVLQCDSRRLITCKPPNAASSITLLLKCQDIATEVVVDDGQYNEHLNHPTQTAHGTTSSLT